MDATTPAELVEKMRRPGGSKKRFLKRRSRPKEKTLDDWLIEVGLGRNIEAQSASSLGQGWFLCRRPKVKDAGEPWLFIL